MEGKYDSEKAKLAGNDFFAKGDNVSALTAYTESIVLNRTNPIVYSNRAATYLKLESWSNAVNDCETALKLIGEDKLAKKALTVKLLWRSSIGLRHLRELQKALDTINEALSLDPKNEKLQTEKKLIEEEMPETHKRIKTEAKLGNTIASKMPQSNAIIIPVQEVEEIPREFYVGSESEKESSPERKRDDVLVQAMDESLGTVEPEIDTLHVKPVYSDVFEFDDITFPQYPSVQFLLSLCETPKDQLPQYFRYLLHVNISHYAQIFQVSGVEPDFLNVYLQACVYALQENEVHYKDSILAVFKVFEKLPRFSLTSMFVDSQVLQQLKSLFKEKLHLNFSDYWK
jgi:tetratricopeptide (TPR) repeat protein